jgi:hypothetical protein
VGQNSNNSYNRLCVGPTPPSRRVPVVRTTQRKHMHRPLVCLVFEHPEHQTLELKAVKQRQTGLTMPHHMTQAERAARKSCWVQNSNQLVAKWQQSGSDRRQTAATDLGQKRPQQWCKPPVSNNQGQVKVQGQVNLYRCAPPRKKRTCTQGCTS